MDRECAPSRQPAPEDSMTDRQQLSRRTVVAASAAAGAAAVLAPSNVAQAFAPGDSKMIRPLTGKTPQADIDNLRARVKATKWPDKEQVDDTSQGVQLATM